MFEHCEGCKFNTDDNEICLNCFDGAEFEQRSEDIE
jgi:hypothetical protein